MAGFLDPKQRVMDVIITELGRQQMMKGEFDVKYVSFSDKGVDYRDQGDGVLEPITDRLFFESFSLASDEIIPEIDSLGKFIINQEMPGTLEVRDGVLYEQNPIGSYSEIDGYSKVTTFADNTTRRFRNLEILNTVSNVDEFSVNQTEFTVQASPTLETNIIGPTDIEVLTPLSLDPRFENQINMRYLPPLFTNTAGESVPFGSYNKWTDSNGASLDPLNVENYQKRIDEIRSSTLTGTSSCKITLGPDDSEAYEHYNILGQVFVSKQQSIKKYIVIDAGEFKDIENVAIARIYFLGFVYKDSLGITKFVREFSIVFHNGETL